MIRMIDLVVRPLAGLLICAAFIGLFLALPTLMTHARAWVSQIREGNLPAPVLNLIKLREDEQEREPDRKAS
jgi:hypothetical protein